jgi:hypothetical protein
MANVFNLPGVPALPSFLSTPSPGLLIGAISSLAPGLQPSLWGIYSQFGIPIIASALSPLSNLILGGAVLNFSVIDFEYKQDWSISTYQVEQGGFQSYDKVQMPFDVRMRVAAGGSVSNRTSLLTLVQSIANTAALYNVVTPEEVYLSCNVSHFDYKRTSINGLGVLIVDIWLLEVRVTSNSIFSNTASPTDTGQSSTGNVQAVPFLTPAQQASIPSFQ